MQVSSKSESQKGLLQKSKTLFSDSTQNCEEGLDSEKELPLKDLIVYPEVYSNETNISETTFGYLEKLGAKIEKRLNKKCNLIIWKDGSIKTVEKAKEYGINVVSLLWLDDCIENFHLADVKKYTKALPQDTDMPFLALKETKKRKTFDSSNPEENIQDIFPTDLLKPTLKKRKKNDSDEDDKLLERISMKLKSSDKREDKTLRRSLTAKPAFGSWLLDFNEKNTKTTPKDKGETRNSTDKEKIRKKEEAIKSSENKDANSSGFNVENIFQKKKEEENSARIRSMIMGYARSNSLGAQEGNDVFSKDEESPSASASESDRSRNSSKSRTRRSYDEAEEEFKSNRRQEDKELTSNSKNPIRRSFTVAEQNASPPSKQGDTTYTFATRVMLRREKELFEKDKEKSEARSSDRRDSSLDIGITAREELMKMRKSNSGGIGDILSKYSIKSDSKFARSEEKKQEEPVRVEKDEEKMSGSKSKNVNERKGIGRGVERKLFGKAEESNDEPKKMEVEQENVRYTRSKKDTPEQLSQSLKMETPVRKGSSTTTLKQGSENGKSSTSDKKTSYSTNVKTPPTKESVSLSKSSIINKYLDSASSNTSAKEKSYNQETLISQFKASPDTGSETKKKSEKKTSETSEGLSFGNLISRLSSTEKNSKSKQSLSSENSEKKQNIADQEEKKEEVLSKTIIKKKTTTEKKEEYIFFTGFVGRTGKIEDFCKTFNLKLLGDEIRNLYRADILVYEGDQIPKNYRVAYTMLRGRPIVNKKWFEESLNAGKLLNYKTYELSYDKEAKKKLLAGLRFYIDKDFEGLTGNMVLKKDLTSLIEEANGKILDNVRSCDFCVVKKMGNKANDIPPHVKLITTQWIIDSVLEGKLLSTDGVNYNF